MTKLRYAGGRETRLWLRQGLLLSVLLFPSLCSDVNADMQSVLPDFYSEPGLHPFRNQVSGTTVEHVDPFSGSLALTHVDLRVPGANGLDIEIRRVYSSNVHLARKAPNSVAPFPDQLLPRTPTGIGWTIHFGRVILSASADPTASICDTHAADPEDDTNNNPVLELPDGSIKVLHVSAITNDQGLEEDDWITRDGWFANCYNAGEGLTVIAPDGTQYRMNHLLESFDETVYTTRPTRAWYTTRVTNRVGEWFDLEYEGGQGSSALLKRIVARDGREVAFNYSSRVATDPRLVSIQANGQNWQYGYDRLSAQSDYFQLTEVTRPDGLSWRYEYYGEEPDTPDHVLRKITYPHGGTSSFNYDYIDFLGESPHVDFAQKFFSVAVVSRTTGGREIQPGTWTYSYNPGFPEDTTEVSFPGGKLVYTHFGLQVSSAAQFVQFWRAGKLTNKKLFDVNSAGGQTLMSEERLTWTPTMGISTEREFRPPLTYGFSQVVVAQLTTREIIRDGTSYITEFQDYNLFDPGKIISTGQGSKTTNLSYFPVVPGQGIQHLVKDEEIQGELPGKNMLRSYDAVGNLTFENSRGVAQAFTYHVSGAQVKQRFDARSNVTEFEDYFRGIPRLEKRPQGVTITRSVNSTGTVAAETNGRGFSTAYLYDRLNRITNIDLPEGDDVAVTWTSTGHVVNRGLYSQTTTVDGYGRTICVDTAGVSQRTDYSSRGDKIFVSHPSYDSCSVAFAGTEFEYDVLGRVRKITHADATTRTYAYLPGNRVRVSNERGQVSTMLFRSFGDPDNANERALLQIDAPEGVIVAMERNIIGQLTRVTQGGVTRVYGYDPDNNFLVAETNPETGDTAYGRDAIGNMISRQVGQSALTNYLYDELNRLVVIGYPEDTPDVSITHDRNNNVLDITSGTTQKSFVYDGNDNLISENHVLNGIISTIGYERNTLGFVETLTYPSGRSIALEPDPLGRPSQVFPYLAGVTFHAGGKPQTLLYANGVNASVSLDSRQWPQRIMAAGNVMDLSYEYDGVGNVLGITNHVVPGGNKTLGYDGLDRLVSALGPWGGVAITYDGTGNIRSRQDGSGNTTYSYGLNNRLNSVSGSINHAFTYDVYGNVASNGDHIFTYDDASNLVEITNGLLIQNIYDGDKQRAIQASNGSLRYFVHARNRNLLGEYDQLGRPLKEYVYLGDKLVAMVESELAQTVPVANAGVDQVADENTLVLLDGSGSIDADGSIVSYLWEQIAGPMVPLLDVLTPVARFMSPIIDQPESLVFRLSVTDNAGAIGSDVVIVRVRNNLPLDIEPPVVTAPPDLVVEATGILTAVDLGIAAALDAVEGPLTPVPDIGGPLSLGTHQVIWSAADQSGNIGTAIQNVVVQDTTPPSLTLPADLTVQTDDLPATVEIGDAVATDIFAPVSITNDAPSVFPLGATTVTWSATDANNNTAIAVQTITIEPDLSAPDPLTAVRLVPGNDQVTILWDKTARTVGVDIFWSTSAAVTPDTGTRIANPVSPHVHRGLTTGQTIHYIFVGVSSHGASSAPSAVFSVTVQPPANEWTNRTVINSGGFVTDFAADGHANAVAVGLDLTGVRPDVWAKRYTGGSGWLSTEIIDQLDSDIDLDAGPSAVMDRLGNIMVMWPQETERVGEEALFVSRHRAGLGWDRPQPISAAVSNVFIPVNTAFPPENRELAVDAVGNAMAVWEMNDGTQTSVLYAARYLQGQGWQPATALSPGVPGTLHFSSKPKFIFDLQGNGLLVWSQQSLPGPGFTLVARAFDTSQGWGPAIVLGQTLSFGVEHQVVMDAQGTATVAWPDQLGLQARRFTPGIGWGGQVTIQATPPDPDVSFDDSPKLAIDGSGRVYVLWATLEMDFFLYANLWASEFNPVTGWSTPRVVVERRQAEADVLVEEIQFDISPDGSGLVSWYEVVFDFNGGEDGDNDTATLYGTRLDDVTGWQQPLKLIGKANIPQQDLSRTALGQGRNRWVVYEKRFAFFDETQNWAARVPADGSPKVNHRVSDFDHQQKVSVTRVDATSDVTTLATWRQSGGGAVNYWAAEYIDRGVPTDDLAMISPEAATVFTSATVVFSWNDIGADRYVLWIGTTQGERDIMKVGAGQNTAVIVKDLPLNGLPFHVRLRARKNDVWIERDYVYTAHLDLNAAAQLVAPVDGTVFVSGQVTFQWTDAQAEVYKLWFGTAPGLKDVATVGAGTDLEKSVKRMPLDGNPIYLRLRTRKYGSWRHHDYIFTAHTDLNPVAEMITPVPGSVLTETTVTFTWTDAAADNYRLWLGTTPGGNDIANVNTGTVTTTTVAGIPDNGQSLYVRLRTRKYGYWENRDYIYTAGTLPGPVPPPFVPF